MLDWDCRNDQGDALFDLSYFLVMHSMQHGTDPATALQQNWTGSGRYSPILRTLVQEWSRRHTWPVTVVLDYIPVLFARAICRYTPTPRFWTPSYTIFRRLFDAWREAEGEIRASFASGPAKRSEPVRRPVPVRVFPGS